MPRKTDIIEQAAKFGYRLPEHIEGVPDGGSKGELELLYKDGGEGINLPMDLGPNLERNGRMVLPPIMRDQGEELYVVNPGFKGQKVHSFKLASERVADTFSLEAGHNVGDWRAWEHGKGNKTIRPKYERSEMLHQSGIFCDNMVWIAEKLDDIHGLLKALGYIPISQKVNRDSDSEDEDSDSVMKTAKKSYFVGVLKKIPSKTNALKSLKCRVALADIPLEEVKFIKRLLQYINSTPQTVDDAKLYTMLKEKFRAEIRLLQIDMKRLYKVIPEARNIKYLDIDLANDGLGTQNSDLLTEILIKEGLPVMDEKEFPHSNIGHGTGVNCVKTYPFNPTGDASSNKRLIIKYYNKNAETVQNPAVRERRGCKMAYLLNPTTAHLQKNVRDKDFYQNGMTRYEVTYEGDWEWEDMIEAFHRYYEHLREALVVCSVSDMLADMGTYISKTIAVLFPLLDNAKIKQLNARCDRDSKNTIEGMPSGFLIRFCNKKTGKFNSVIISPKSNTHGDAFTQFQKAVAWGSTQGEDPDVFVCVAGCEQYLCKDFKGTQGLGTLIRNLYFRKVPARRVLTNGGDSTDMKTYLMKNSGFVTGNNKNLTDDFNQIGVDIQQQKCLRLAVVKKGDKNINIRTMKISMEFVPYEEAQQGTEALEVISLVSSETLERMNLRVKSNHVKMMPVSDIFQPWEGYKNHKNGLNKHRKPCIVFKFCGDSYSLPAALYADVNSWCGEDPLRQAIVHVRRTNSNGFECHPYPLTTAAQQQALPGLSDLQQQQTDTASVVQFSGKVGSQFKIPRSDEPMKIVGGFLRNSKGSQTVTVIVIEGSGSYTLPHSISKQLSAHFMVTDIPDGNLLAGCKVVHTESRMARMVGCRKGNDEEYVLIQDADGVTIAESVPSRGRNSYKRKRQHNDTDDEDSECTAKCPRRGV